MIQTPAESNVPESRRKDIFLALVDAQDRDVSVAESRKLVAERFGIAESQIREIEREGMKQQWPPL